MSADLLDEFRTRGIELWADAGQIHYRALPGSLTPELIDRLKAHKAQLLPCLPDRATDRITRLPEQSYYEVSRAQRRIWVLSQLKAASAAYNIPLRFALDGELDPHALAGAIESLVARHESLRTTFVSRNGNLRQVIHVSGASWLLREIDLSVERNAEIRLRALASAEAAEPFNLERGPLLRVCLVRVGPARHVLLFTVHHIVCDGWSFRLIMKDLTAFYKAAVSGASADAPPLLVQYRDYAAWQNRALESGTMRSQRDYWLAKLGGELPVLDLPLDATRPLLQSLRGGSLTVRFDALDCGALRDYARARRASVFCVLLALIKVLLYRYTGQSDIVVGTAVAGRNRTELEDQVGCYVNTLVLRDFVDPDESFDSLVRQVRRTMLEALDHQDYPFDHLVEVLKVSRDPSRSPLFNVMVVGQSAAELNAQMRAVRISHLPLPSEMSKFDLSFDCEEGADFVNVGIEYNADLFTAERIARMGEHLRVLLRAALHGPALAVHALPLLPATEWHEVVRSRNQTGTACPPPTRTLVGWFETQVAMRPGAIAVTYEGRQLTYGELNARANQLAHHLISLGVGPEVLVGICLERSLELIVGLLGILKAGAAYVPLDPAYPSERLTLLMEDSAMPVVVTQESLAGKLRAQTAQALLLDAHWEAIACASAEEPLPRPRLEDVAYVIYTSGSTGMPKGVMVTHANAARLFTSTENWFGFGPRDVWTLFHSHAFDFSVWEIWGALLHGGRLVVVPHWVSRSPDAFRQLLVREEITVLNQTPSAFYGLIQADAAAEPGFGPLRLRYVIFGGEALDIPALRPWIERHGTESPRLINMYGITETTVHVTYRVITAADLSSSHSVIGWPIPDLQLYVLDTLLQPMPLGVAGEICVGGAGVAKGYLNRPELTAERFVPDPFSPGPGARLYRSGDLGRHLPNGDMEYLGRIDQQVKVRGFRIELGEIEAVLAEHAAVRQSAVIAREDTPGDKRLVAYVVPVDVSWNDTEQLRASLRERLPDYMRPAAYVVLDRLPLTPNGKLDRKTLPAPDVVAYASPGYEAPIGEVETALAQIWSEVLKIEQVGRHDHFFELGGHSLLAVSVLERMRQAGLHADIRALFVTPTLAELAAVVGGAGQTVEVPANRIPPACNAITLEMLPLVQLTVGEIERIAAAVPGGAANIQDIYPLAPLQEGILFHHQMSVEGDPYLVSASLGFDNRDRLQRYLQALQAVIDRHDILRTAVLWEGLPEPVQVVWRRAPLVVEEVSLPGVGDVAEALHSRFDPRHYRLDVRHAPLIRVFIAEDAANARWVVLQLFHHLSTDHTTQEIVEQEIQAHLLGRASQLPASQPFRNFVAQARLGVSAEEHRAFFTEMLGDVDEPTMPFGLADVLGEGGGIAEARRPLEASLAGRLRERASALGVSAASVCHLAWAQVLARVSGREDVVFGTLLFGRMQGGSGADRVPGLFINTLPVRIRVDDTSVEESVRRTHALLAHLLRHEHAPLALAQRCSAVAAPLPLFSALLNYRHSPVPAQAAPETLHAFDGIVSLGHVERTNYPLALAVDDLGEGFELAAQAGPPIGPHRVCEFMHTAIEQLVMALESAPAAPLRSIDVLPESERRQWLMERNGPAAAPPNERCLHQLFEEQAARTPGSVAVVFDDRQLTYAELDARANQLAHHLIGLGVKPEVLVGLCVERSLDLIVGWLGVLKAGGAYVPLDPAYPPARLAFMLADAQAPLLLTQYALLGRLPEFAGRVFCLDRDWELVAAQPTVSPRSPVTPGNLAYVIHTSGSTGKPKGVMVPHQGLANVAEEQRRHFRVRAGDRVLQFASASFDASVAEFVTAFHAGAELHLAARDSLLPGSGLFELLRDRAITHVTLPPSLLDASDVVELPALKTLIVAGEACSPGLVRRWSAGRRLLNAYGPTEATIWSTVAECVAGEQKPVIGRPIANVRVYVLDAWGRPAPAGVPGELYVAGSGLARGYLNRPELTAEKFLPDPFSPVEGARMYRTGDLARSLPDGNLEYLGRIDDQVKIRGFRIELSEIEAVLSECPAVREVVAVAREEAPGDKRVVAYVVPADPPLADSGPLRAFLRERLPDYMQPAAWVLIERMPLTPNGKIGRRALPPPQYGRDEALAFVAPRTPLESLLAGLCADLLGVERVGVHDDFFALGGHSLLATRLVTRLRDVLKLRVTIREFFGAPSVAALAGTLSLHEENRERVEAIARMSEKLATLSEEEKRQLIARKQARQREATR